MSPQFARGSDRLRDTLGTTRGWRRRLFFHHVPLALVSIAGTILFVFISVTFSHGGGRVSLSQYIIATGYVAAALVAFTLLIGPANLLLRRRNPVSTYLRRDMGAWAAIVSVVHVILGFELPFGPPGFFNFVGFFFADGRPLINSFGLGNWTGLLATVIAVGLLVISTDRYMRELKAGPWKSLQRLNYTLFALVVLHAIFYGALTRMTSPLTVLLILSVVVVVLGQAIGIWLWRRRISNRASRESSANIA